MSYALSLQKKKEQLIAQKDGKALTVVTTKTVIASNTV